MYLYYHHMILDKTTITTRIRIHPDLVANPVTFIRKRTKQVRSIKPSLDSATANLLGTSPSR